jgi:FixJ family two-component response regulator
MLKLRNSSFPAQNRMGQPVESSQLDQLLTAIASAAAGIRKAEERNKDADRARAQIAELSGRECEVLNGLLAGNKEMGRVLGISPRTVEAHRSHLMQHLGVKTIPEVVRVAALADLHADR